MIGDREEKDEDDLAGYGPKPDLEGQFARLQLHGEEEEDLDFSEVIDELIQGVDGLGCSVCTLPNRLAMELCLHRCATHGRWPKVSLSM